MSTAIHVAVRNAKHVKLWSVWRHLCTGSKQCTRPHTRTLQTAGKWSRYSCGGRVPALFSLVFSWQIVAAIWHCLALVARCGQCTDAVSMVSRRCRNSCTYTKQSTLITSIAGHLQMTFHPGLNDVFASNWIANAALPSDATHVPTDRSNAATDWPVLRLAVLRLYIRAKCDAFTETRSNCATAK